jgi:hypothetical protein
MELRVPLVSSSESVGQGRISALAVVETIAASGLSFWLAWKQHSVEHIVIASALAPFLLLRTHRSTKYTLFILERLEHISMRHIPDDVVGIIVVIVNFFFIPFIKILATLRSLFSHLPEHILAISYNFYKYVFTVNLLQSPQAVPEADQIYDLHQYPTLLPEFNNAYDVPKYLLHMATEETLFGKIIGMLAMVVTLSPIILLSFSFRLAIKSTAILWLPLLWLIYQSRPGESVINRMDYQIHTPWYIMILMYSGFVVLGGALKIALYIGVWRFINLQSFGPVGELATRLVAPTELPGWQIASFINALLAWAFGFWAVPQLRAHVKHSTEARSEASLRREYTGFQAVRTTLSLYSIACTFYIAASTAWQTEWPGIRFVLFPWASP